MSTTTLVTADELLTMPTGMGKRYELVAGELRVMSPARWSHGIVVGRLHNRLGPFIEQHKLGLVFGAETGFRLATNPDTVRAPDIAFVSRQNVPKNLPAHGFWPGSPDLAIEVVSPSDSTSEVDEKIDAWLNAGCSAVWIIDLKLETVTIYISRTDVQIRTSGDLLEGGTTVPGFSCKVSDLFQ
jgi:Uma2 family endonuclease